MHPDDLHDRGSRRLMDAINDHPELSPERGEAERTDSGSNRLLPADEETPKGAWRAEPGLAGGLVHVRKRPAQRA